MKPNRIWQFLETVVGPVIAILFALVVVMLILLVSGQNPVNVLFRSLGYSLFTGQGILNTVAVATPLILTGTTWAVGVRAGVFNVGAEGALLVGAVAAIAVGALFELPVGFHHLIVMLAAAAAGALWIFPAAYLKTKRNVHEVVSTIMLNWTATFLASFLIVWPLRDPKWPMRSLKILPSARFQPLARGSSLTLVFVVSVAFALFSYILLWHTKLGQHIRATGFNPHAARISGINVVTATLLAFSIGGAAAGLAGYALTAGLPPLWSISEKLGTLTGYGFSGICVSAIGANHPLGIVLAAVFFGGLLNSRSYMQMFFGVAPETTDVIAGTIILVLAIPELSRLFFSRRRGVLAR